MKVDVYVDIDTNEIEGKLNKLLHDKRVMLNVHNTLAKMCEPYVPYLHGNLSESGMRNVTPDGVTYIGDYARYQYFGEVYGPNYHYITDDGMVRWYSPPTKSPTGRPIIYNTEWVSPDGVNIVQIPRGNVVHPLASAKWDKAMLRDHKDDFNKQVKDILVKEARNQWQ